MKDEGEIGLMAGTRNMVEKAECAERRNGLGLHPELPDRTITLGRWLRENTEGDYGNLRPKVWARRNAVVVA